MISDLSRLRARSLRCAYAAVLLLSLAAGGPRAAAQKPSFDASQLREPAPLDPTWLVHPGDDLKYAIPEFDDSGWTPFNPYNSIDALFGKSRPPIIWYRLRVKVDPSQKGLGLSEFQISQAFEVYANGERVMSSGSVLPFRPFTMNARVLIPIPDRLLKSGSLVLALRVHISPNEWVAQNPGFYATNLTIGQYRTLSRDNWLTIIGENSVGWLDHFLLIGLGFIALVLLAGQRRQDEYRWIAAVGALTLLQTPEPVITQFVNVPEFWEIASELPRLASPYVWTSLYFSFVHQRLGWRWRAFLILAGVLNALSSMHAYLFTSTALFQLIGNLPFVILLAVVIPVVLAIHRRRGNREAGILLIPAVLLSLYIYAAFTLSTLFQIPAWRNAAIRGFTLVDHYPIGPFFFSLNTFSGIASTVALAVIMLLRSSTMTRRQAQIESELQAAQQVQQVLVPEQIGDTPGFSVDSVYLPAQQVGGDFFQVLPVGDGGLLVVVGDVAGKGLPAAMLVSVLVGAIRATAEFTHDPGALLRNLNDRLVGRGTGGFSTAVAALIARDGRVSIANAGHLSPYLDGREIDLPGALPLGVAAGLEYQVTGFFLGVGSRLTFYSDGVVEAQNRQGDLLGFDRGRELSTQSAADIADAAKRFGQQDDITVVTIERRATVQAAA